jgi:hypothetical protein
MEGLYNQSQGGAICASPGLPSVHSVPAENAALGTDDELYIAPRCLTPDSTRIIWSV